jgi:hypothetical protein
MIDDVGVSESTDRFVSEDQDLEILAPVLAQKRPLLTVREAHRVVIRPALDFEAGIA